MIHDQCSNLADFLDRDLSDDDRQRFLDHLPNCAACRSAAQQTSNMDDLLRRATELESVPERVSINVYRRFVVQRRRRVVRQLATAAALLLAGTGLVVWWLMSGQRITEKKPIANAPAIPPKQELKKDDPKPKKDNAKPMVRVVVNNNRGIVIPAKSDDPNITMVWVFPSTTVNAKRQNVAILNSQNDKRGNP